MPKPQRVRPEKIGPLFVVVTADTAFVDGAPDGSQDDSLQDHSPRHIDPDNCVGLPHCESADNAEVVSITYPSVGH